MVNIVFFCFQIRNSISAEYRHSILILYFVQSALSFIIIALSFKKTYGVKFSYHASILLILRLNIRWLDFENSRETRLERFKYMLLYQSTGVYFILGSLPFLYANIKYNKFVILLLFISSATCLAFGANEKGKDFQLNFIFWSSLCMFIGYTPMLLKYIPNFYDILS